MEQLNVIKSEMGPAKVLAVTFNYIFVDQNSEIVENFAVA
jgi:hypothetical protein